MEPVNETANGYSITTQIAANQRNLGHKRVEAAFHDVTVVGYTEERDVICRNEIGTMELGDSRQITLECETLPDYLTFVAAGHGCEYESQISVLEVRDPQADLLYGDMEDKNCDEESDLPTGD